MAHVRLGHDAEGPAAFGAPDPCGGKFQLVVFGLDEGGGLALDQDMARRGVLHVKIGGVGASLVQVPIRQGEGLFGEGDDVRIKLEQIDEIALEAGLVPDHAPDFERGEQAVEAVRAPGEPPNTHTCFEYAESKRSC